MFPIKSLQDLEKISKEVKWQYFEKLVGWIFEQNDFEVGVNQVILFEKASGVLRRQFDVIAKRFNKTFLIECKKWKGNRYKASALKRAVESHIEKATLFKEKRKEEIIPVIVTMLQEDIIEHEGVPIVPIDKLNTFINHHEEFIDK